MAALRADRLKAYREIAAALLLLGVTWGGPAIMAIMQAELQERRQWVTKARLVEGLSLVTALPGATALQLGIFLGYHRGGWWGGLIAGLCFVLPAFFIMLALAAGYVAYGALPFMKGALYGLAPVVLGVFLVAMYRLGRSVVGTPAQLAVAAAAAAAGVLTPLGVAPILAFGAAVGLTLFYSRTAGALVACVTLALAAVARYWAWSPVMAMPGTSAQAGLVDIGSFFLMVGALIFGGGLSLIAFIQDHVVSHYRWLTAEEFLAGLALGQFTPGPIIMVAAYVGYKLAGVAGAATAAGAIFLPSFVLMLSILPVFDKVSRLLWIKAAVKGIGPAVIGVLGLSLLHLAPHAVRDLPTALLFAATVGAMVAWQAGILKLLAGGAVLGVLHALVSA